jgi:hypothetical protein
MRHPPAGYSGTPLARKLGIKEGHRMLALHPPPDYLDLLKGLPEGVSIRVAETPGIESRPAGRSSTVGPYDLIHVFALEKEFLAQVLPDLKRLIVSNGAIWASWPKKASSVPTDLSGNVVRGLALENGLVDVKVCAVDWTWSALKLVIPLKDRPKP